MIPLGKAEGPELEFKGRAVLERPALLARSVVSMLNARGGVIWVGIREEQHRAVAIEGIPDAIRVKERLWNSLVDTIEPRPSSEEVELELEDAGGGEPILRLSVKPDDVRRPYAVLREGGRFFHVRSGSRTNIMEREDLRLAFARVTKETDPLEQARKKLVEARNAVQDSDQSVYWLRLQPVVPIKVDIKSDAVRRLLTDPSATGNRPHGWTFFIPYVEPRLRQGRLCIESDSFGSLCVWDSGEIEHRLPLESMVDQKLPGPPRLLHPWALLEYPASVFRLAGALYGKSAPVDGDVLAHVMLLGAGAFELEPFGPREAFYGRRVGRGTVGKLNSNDFMLDAPLRFTFTEILSEPDQCAFRLMARLYEDFGYTEALMPREFDRQRKQLLLSQ